MKRRNKFNSGNVLMLGLMLFWLLGSVIVGVIVGVAYVMGGESIGIMPILMLSQAVMFGVPFLIYMKVSKRSFKEVLPMTPLDGKNLMYVILITVVSMPIMSFIAALGSMFFTNHIEGVLMDVTGYPVWMGIVAIAVFPSFFEEIFFRGALYKTYEKFPLKKAMIVNGLFFGIIHLNVQQFLYAAVIGMLFTLFRHYTKSMIAPMLGHFIINGFNTGMMYLVMGSDLTAMTPEEMYAIEAMSDGVAVGFVGAFALAMVPLLVFLLRRFVAYNQEEVVVSEEVTGGELAEDVPRQRMVDAPFVVVVLLFVLVVIVEIGLG